ncbi:MAG: AMIN domain-containing protein [Desulfuromonadaceae bacterium]|nr:AMIN domain-containing protein [Desulfuromonadaceae bacterium]MDD5104858.1 AMIN domain-containing protein [Desulfuromonadaceae bacterium]
MNKIFSAVLVLTLISCLHSVATAAQLLDVRPTVVGSAVSVDISADSAMTYTYYKVPGQARAVVDIAEADPEKIEPLIVVNKGNVASISVDKVEVSGLVVSRIIFNLISESDISVASTFDRKKLTVLFAGSPVADASSEQALPMPAEPAAPAAVAAPAAMILPNRDAPPAKPVLPSPHTKTNTGDDQTPAPPTIRTDRLEPVVPIAMPGSSPVYNTALTITAITAGTSYIDIHANRTLAEYKAFRLHTPERLVIDIPTGKVSQKPGMVAINKFGISKARIGVSLQYIRVVLDCAKTAFPYYTISSIDNGLRIRFK